VADVGVALAPISLTVFTDPFCPWSWAAEPHLRRLDVEFGAGVALTFVVVGLRRQIHDTGALALASLDASAESGTPVDPRVFLRDPPSSTHPAGLAADRLRLERDRGALRRPGGPRGGGRLRPPGPARERRALAPRARLAARPRRVLGGEPWAAA